MPEELRREAEKEQEPKTPGGPVRERPIQQDGKWYHFGEEVSEERATALNRDHTYARQFWQRMQEEGLSPEQIRNYENALRGQIQNHAEQGLLLENVSAGELADKDKEKLSALRELASEMGYEVGQFRRGEEPGLMRASLHKIETD
ncbi:MAG: hypothetical protein A2806_01480 [Candidatus Terrybacteria bacterium RIFCSPHIGHO2_01_FULL_48_17]|uniref:Uncharacterized protein n=1 Tax=Candidatus Terrybacteria bacterium RIFCSPHIGHO2_01_FULL_48_17 TaxID=1802362 RepID=A0A1G2PHE2_9BACT|nr:MAG: hypothetical protein A2806_01480 [Candidatus Terrybacteria bacterium RIFCSPHIGHO2_01_FULL_48_17]OHA52271.1 MAG: hypothetical protein A3A30_04735 [Candidatus Terrybacteria bacterium RIFCSPLOWO2_01_FULL_48_14]